MTLQTLKLSQIIPSTSNPRTGFDEVSISGLAQSIKQDGLLQNLVVCKPKGKKKKYDIISGERRYRALCLLQESGDLAEDYEVAVEIREGLTKDEILRLATVENLQREDMHPMDEAEAIALLLSSGENIDDVSAKTGLSLSVIKRRLALADLCEEAKTALRADEITLSQGEALTIGSLEQQKELIEDGLGNHNASQIKRWLTDEKANVAMAIFDRELYTGTYTHDLFADDDTTYFDDVEQFLALQEQGIKNLKSDYETKGFEPVEIVDGYSFNRWQYRDADMEDGEKGGVVIQLYNNGRVECHEGLVDKTLDKKTKEETAGNPFVEAKPKPTYNRPTLEYIAMHKTLAVQCEMVKNRRIAKEAAVAQMIGGGDWVRKIVLDEHKALSHFDNEAAPCPAWLVIEEEAKILSQLLGKDLQAMNGDACVSLIKQHGSPTLWYEAVKTLSDDDLDRLHVFLTTLCFGQGNTDRLDTNQNSLFNRVAVDLGIDMRNHWYADEEFLKRRNKEQLADIVKETGSTRLFGAHLDKFKKGEIVKFLAKHFKAIFENGASNEEEQKAKDWLPQSFAFPAIDPDKKQDDEEIEEEGFEGYGEFEDEEDDYAEAA